ncbi:MAG: hypothetical protein JXA33_20460 [Anaerolineae bacterium]|nr:hypothetical protein [Anaerolineae bacterium]
MLNNDLNVMRETYKFKHQDLVHSMRGYTEIESPTVKNPFVELPKQIKRFFAILKGDIVLQPPQLECSAVEC